MRFQSIRRYLGGDAETYLRNVLSGSFEDLITGLSKLTFRDNFLQYQWEGTIAANTTEQIQHHLGVIPSGRIIYRASGGIVQDSATDSPTDKYWFLTNTDASDDATLTVIFFR